MKYSSSNFIIKRVELFQKEVIFTNTESISIIENMENTENFAEIYQEIANAAGTETAVAIYLLFRGQQIMFPQKLYKKDYIYNYIRQSYNGKNVRELSQKFGYSDRRIRQIVSGMSDGDKKKRQ